MKPYSLVTMTCVIVSAIIFDVTAFERVSGNDSLDKGEAFYEHSRFDEAVAALSYAIEKDPKAARAFFLRASAYYNKCDFGQAIADFDAGLALSPDNSQAYYNRAVVYYSMQDYDRAWQDAYRASSLGYRLDPVFFEQLKEDSGRQQ
jgi:tetratricopeptide (TPR) repeat protein